MRLVAMVRAWIKYGLAVLCVTTTLLSSSLLLQQITIDVETDTRGESLQAVLSGNGGEEAENILEQQLRRRQVSHVCSRMRRDQNQNGSMDFLTDETRPLDANMFDNMYVDDKYKLMFCEIPKVACTNFKIIMLLLTGQMNTTDPMQLRPDKVHGEYSRKYLHKLSSFTDSEIRHKLKHYFKVMIVRDPLERLLSAYRNKFTVHYNDYFKIRFGRNIIKKYRQNPTQVALETGGDVTFDEFVQYVIDPATSASGEFNQHWRQYYRLCHPCQLQYEFIGKYESITDDMAFLLRLLNVQNVISMPASRISGTRTSDLMGKYFKNITSEQLHSLWQVYSTDFNMFGYSYPDFK